MRVAFLTMVWRDYWLLDKWVRHNSQWVPKSQLYVLNHGGDPRVAEIAAGCNVIHVPREEITRDLTRKRWDLVGGVTNGLLAFYDRVVCTDVDELLFYAGTAGTLIDHLRAKTVDGQALSPVGLNLIPTPEDVDDPALSVLQQHPHALVSGRYTKPCIAAERVQYTIGGHGLVGGEFEIDPEIVLCHLHYVTPDYAERMAARREIVDQSIATNAQSDAPLEMPKNYWANWAEPGSVKEKEFQIFASAEEMDVSASFEPAAALLRSAIGRNGRRRLIKPKLMAGRRARVTVPERWRALI